MEVSGVNRDCDTGVTIPECLLVSRAVIRECDTECFLVSRAVIRECDTECFLVSRVESVTLSVF